MSTESQLLAFIARHRVLLAKERDAEVDRSSLLLSNCAPKLLEQKGLSLGGLGVVGLNIGIGGKTLVELDRPTAYHTSPIFPPHTLRPGDLARIEENVSGNGTKKPAKTKKNNAADVKSSRFVEGVVYKVSDTRIVIAVDLSDSNPDDIDLPERCCVLKLANSVTYDRMEKTLDQLEKTVVPSSRASGTDKAPQEITQLVRVLLGMSQPSAKTPITNIRFFDESLNASQQEAVKFALESPEIACIHGPPGTGKTHTLIEIIRQLTSVSSYNPKPLRLLVCGASNLSVDNILERLLDLPLSEKGEKLKVTRIGHPARVMAHEGILDSTLDVKAGRTDQAALAKDVKNELDSALGLLSGKGKGAKGKRLRGAERKKIWEEVRALRKEYRKREGGVVKSVLGGSQIVVATCHSSGGRQLWQHDFDVAIIDEATQALEAVCWIPIFKAKKLILAGDPMQLPPTILSVEKEAKRGSESKLKSGDSQKNVHNPRKADSGATHPGEKRILEPSRASSTGYQNAFDTTDSGSNDSSDSEMDDVGADIAVSDEPPPLPPTDKQVLQRRPGFLRPPRTLETTLFDRLEMMYGPSIKRMLNVQYRMHSHICEFPSKTLYSSKLMSDSSVATHLLCDLPGTKAVSEDEEKEILGTPVVFFDTAGCEYFERLEGDGDDGSRCNENEAIVVKGWVEQLVGAGVLPSQIAVITPYQAQVTLITTLLRPLYGAQLEIGTVDGMQGREKDAIVISLVRSNENREVGFLKEKRRLNVAMTRAKRHLCVVGDSSTVQHGGRFLKNWLIWLDNNADVRYAGPE